MDTPAYSFMSIEKVKSAIAFQNKNDHNFRLRNVSNADPTRENENEILIDMKHTSQMEEHKERIEQELEKKGKTEIGYWELAADRIKTVKENTGRKVRKDAVLGIEVMCTFSGKATENVNLDVWKKANIEWLQTTFGEKNVISAVLHMDEAVPHIHAMVLPTDEQETRFQAKRWIGGQLKMRELQDSYGKKMQEFGLERGAKGVRTSHTKIRDLYKSLNSVTADIPEKKLGEPQKSYVQRLIKCAENRGYKAENLELQMDTLIRQNTANKKYREIAETKVEDLSKKLEEQSLQMKTLERNAYSFELIRRGLEDAKDKELKDKLNNMILEQREKEEKEQKLEQNHSLEKEKEKEIPRTMLFER